MDVDLHDSDVDTKAEIQEIREEVDSAANYLIKKNPLAQFGRFLYSLSRSIIETGRGNLEDSFSIVIPHRCEREMLKKKDE